LYFRLRDVLGKPLAGREQQQTGGGRAFSGGEPRVTGRTKKIEICGKNS